MNGLEALKNYMFDMPIEDYDAIEKELKALEILKDSIIIDDKGTYVKFYCEFSLPTNSKYENEEHYREKIELLKEVLK